MNDMKWKEGSPLLEGFYIGDFETPIRNMVQEFIKICLDEAPPKLALVYLHTTGNPLIDGQYWEGFRPENPLTLRLYLNSFLPDDGTSIIYETTIPNLIQDSLKRNPDPKTMQAVYDELEKQMQVIKSHIDNYKEEDEDEE